MDELGLATSHGCWGPQVNLSQFPRATLGYEKLREKFPAAPLTYDGSVSSGPTLSDEGFDLLKRLLHHDPSQRITAEEAYNHKWCAQCLVPPAPAPPVGHRHKAGPALVPSCPWSLT